MIYRVLILIILLTLSSQFTRQANIYSSKFRSNEQFEYTLHYGVFKVGRAAISNTRTDSGCGYKLTALARTTGMAKLFRRLHYSFNCCMDIENGWPLTTSMDMLERNYQIQNKVFFDHESRPDSSIIQSQHSGQIVVKKGTFDILTCFHYFRGNMISENMEIGKYENFDIYYWDEVYDMKIKYMGKEIIKSKMGKLECLKVNPRTDIGRFFKTNDDMSIWFTNDKYCIPVMIVVDFRFGTIKAHLSKTNLRSEALE